MSNSGDNAGSRDDLQLLPRRRSRSKSRMGIASQLGRTKVRRGTTTTMHMDGSHAETNGEEFVDELLSLSRKHWLVEGKKRRPTFQAKVVDQIFQGLSERSFPLRELVVLDQSQYLERYVLTCVLGVVLMCDSYLWPNFSKTASDQHVLSIALLTTVKAHESVPIWGIFHKGDCL